MIESPIVVEFDKGSPSSWLGSIQLRTGEVFLDSGKDNHAEYATVDVLALYPQEQLLFEPHEVIGLEKKTIKALEEFSQQPWVDSDGKVISLRAWSQLSKKLDLPLPFCMCALSYELGAQAKGIRPRAVNHIAPALWAARYDALYIWDRQNQKGWLVGVSTASIERLELRINHAQFKEDEDLCSPLTELSSVKFEPQCQFSDYRAQFESLSEHLDKGNLYQMNLTLPLSLQLGSAVSSLILYRHLREVNSGQFSFYVQIDAQRSLLSFSPERLVKWDGYKLLPSIEQRFIETAPIKGTRPRGSTHQEDKSLLQELLTSKKDAAEHVMILDLERNDLSRLCKSASVRVIEDRRGRSYATVHHLVSVVRGELDIQHGLADILDSLFPGGSVTGAPKYRSMQEIRSIEPFARGIYCGALGYLDPIGGGDLNLPIRTLVQNHQTLIYHAGGGIVADSTVEGEWQELWVKTKGMEKVFSPS